LTGRFAHQSEYSIRAILFSLLTILACADVAPPPGGPVDRTGPYLLGSEPASGAVNVPIGNRIKLYFSEATIPPATDQPIFIAPRQEEKARIKWKSNWVELILEEDFAPDQTYIVSVSSDLKDLRGNAIDSSLVIAFSTGSSIDSGVVAGYVFAGGQPSGGVWMALYQADLFAGRENDSTLYDSLYPTYLTHTTQTGRFEFKYLPQKEYRLVGFRDANRSERFNPFREQFALPDRDIIVGGELDLDDLQMEMTSHDTTRIGPISAGYTTDRLLKLRFSRPLELSQLKADLSLATVRSLTETDVSVPVMSLLESDLDQSATLELDAGLLKSGAYRVEVLFDTLRPPVVFDSVVVEPVADRQPPQVVRFYPDNKPRFAAEIDIRAVFSEPLDIGLITAGTFVLEDDDEQAVPLTLEWQDRLHLRLHPVKLQPGKQYRLAVTEFEVADLSGNLLGDSLRHYRFSVLGSDSVGWVSGEIAMELPDREFDPIVLSFKGLAVDGRRGGKQAETVVTKTTFKIELPAGKYLMSGFVDSDGDGKRLAGSVFPWRLAETLAHYPDTITVRPRFETTGLTFVFK
jgi:hypothetical protein